MNTQPSLQDCERVLVVEGYSDLHFYIEILEHLGTHQGVFIKHFNGASDLTAQLKTGSSRFYVRGDVRGYPTRTNRVVCRA
jgi:hypothetical protein